MDIAIQELKSYPYSGKDILELLDGKTKVLVYSDLKNFNNIDEVLYPYDCAVILYETKKNYGHWTCILKHPERNEIEYYDPLGYFIDDIISQMSPQKRRELDQQNLSLSNLLYNSNYNIVYNNKRIQKSNKKINSCGRHVGVRLILKDNSLNDYIKIITNSKLDPDDTVTYLTAFI